MVQQYSLKKDGDKNITENFKVREFACNDGTDKILIDLELVKRLQTLRDKLGVIQINSAYRTKAYNKKVGGVADSQHLLGRACDIVAKNYGVITVRKEAKALGLFVVEYPSFTHVDTRLIKDKPAPKPQRLYIVKVKTRLNIRDKRLIGKVVGSYKNGEIVDVLLFSYGWAKTNRGWVSSLYLKKK